MTLTEKQFYDICVRDALHEDISLFLGAGVSIKSGYSSWRDLMRPCAESLDIVLSDETDLSLIAQYYANIYGTPNLKRIISEQLNKISQQNDYIEALLDINFQTIWTTNFDSSIEKALSKRQISPNKVFDDRDLVNINCNNRLNLYKINGDINNTKNIVITKQDFEHYSQNHEMILTFLKKELISNTFLFIGYSFTDSLILQCLSLIMDYLDDDANYHYTIMKNNDDPLFQYFVFDLEKRYHIKTLLVDDYDDITLVLKELSDRIKSKRVFISGSYDDVPKSMSDLADGLSQNLVFALYEQDYRICTGVGKKVGAILTGYAYRYLLEHNIVNIEKYLIMRPFPFHNKKLARDEGRQHRELLMSDSRTAIFIFGKSQNDPNELSTGVLEEFEIAKEKGMIIIPVGATEYTARKIWSEIKNNIVNYPYLERYIDPLGSEKDPIKLAEIILTIINDTVTYTHID
jgi:hypothetical protein